MNSTNERGEKVFVFGIDGATFSLMKKWVERGELPTIKSLMDSGTASVCHSTIPPNSCPAWKSFATGMNPGNLGIFDLMCKEPGTYRIRPSQADMVDSPDLWDILSAHQYKVGVFNVPVTYPPHSVNGFIFPGMLSNPDAPDFTYPPGLKTEIENIIGTSYQINVESTREHDLDAWLEAQHTVTQMKEDTAKYLLEHKEWDFFIAVFCEVDRVQHRFWHFMDEDHPRHAPSHHEHTIRNSYKRMDRILREMLDLLEEDVTVIVMSDHGFGPVKGYFRINQWLLSKNYMHFDEESVKTFFRDVAMRYLRKEAPREQSVSNIIGDTYNIDWSKTKAFAILTGNLYLNVRGREPEGIIEMEGEYEEIRTRLMKDLSALIHPQTNEQLKVTIHKKEDVYFGKYLHDAPDLIVSIEEYAYLIEQGFGPTWGGFDNEGGYSTGGHRMDGIFIASGRDIKNKQWIDPIPIVDIAPTILHIMHMKIPREMDGTVLLPLFKEGSSPASRKVEILPAAVCPTKKHTEGQLEKHLEDDEKVLKRLEDLGYLE